MQRFKEIFEQYGADYKITMERFMGNEELYLKFLNMLFEDDNLQKLEDALTAGNMTGAFEAAHTLKGVVGNMGLSPLYKVVCELVESLRRQEAMENHLALNQAIKQEFEKARKLRENLNAGE